MLDAATSTRRPSLLGADKSWFEVPGSGSQRRETQGEQRKTVPRSRVFLDKPAFPCGGSTRLGSLSMLHSPAPSQRRWPLAFRRSVP